MANPGSRPERRRLVEGGPVEVPVGSSLLRGDLVVPEDASGMVLFAHGTGSNRNSPRNHFVAEGLRHEGFATLLIDLLTEEEIGTSTRQIDWSIMASRLEAASGWVQGHPATLGLPIGYFGASTGAAVALLAAAEMGADIRAVVSRGGRPDLVGPSLEVVQSPTLLIVGSFDETVLDLNRLALERLGCREKQLEIVSGASHLFEEPGALDLVLRHATCWYRRHLGPGGE